MGLPVVGSNPTRLILDLLYKLLLTKAALRREASELFLQPRGNNYDASMFKFYSVRNVFFQNLRFQYVRVCSLYFYKNYKNFINLLYVSSAHGLPAVIATQTSLKSEVRVYNAYIKRFSTKTYKTQRLIVFLENNTHRQFFFSLQNKNYFIVKPVATLAEYGYASYPLYINAKTDVSQFFLFSLVKGVTQRGLLARAASRYNIACAF